MGLELMDSNSLLKEINRAAIDAGAVGCGFVVVKRMPGNGNTVIRHMPWLDVIECLVEIGAIGPNRANMPNEK